MTEKEIRKIVLDFIKVSVRQVVVPAAFGASLALSGCGDSADDGKKPDPKIGKGDDPGAVALYAAPFQPLDAGVPTMKYMAPFMDAGEPTVKYMAPFADAGIPTVKYMAPFADAGIPTVKYMAPFADAGVAPADEAGGPVALYAAPFPVEASVAPDEDGGGPVALYAAPFPDDE